jgi:hypothetical protein
LDFMVRKRPKKNSVLILFRSGRNLLFDAMDEIH